MDTPLPNFALEHNMPTRWGLCTEGILRDLANAALGVAFASTLQFEASFTTLELKITFLRPVLEGGP